jgi:membrane fusion protein PltH
MNDAGAKPKKLLILIIMLIVVFGGGGSWWKLKNQTVEGRSLILYGVTDIREAHLAFRVSDRLDSMLVDEGDWVEQGQMLAKLDTTILQANLDEYQAMAQSAAQTLNRLKNGSRPEEIASAQAATNEAIVIMNDAKRKLDEVLNMQSEGAASQREIESTKAEHAAAEDRVDRLESDLALLIEGPRKEDIAKANAELQAAQARVSLAQQNLNDATLVSPTDGVIRVRLHEPGEMVGPSTPVLLLAETDPVWVRVYIDESDLGKTELGMKASITIDSHPGEVFEGWLGSISPTAEFTPKPIATEELRTRLVYQARVFVRDPQRIFKLGMPATVVLSPKVKSDPSATEPAS